MFGLVCTRLDELLEVVASLVYGLLCAGLDELLDGVASLED